MSTFGTIHGGGAAAGARGRARRQLEAGHRSARARAAAPAESTTEVTPFLPPVDAAKAGRAGCVSMAHVAAHKGDVRELARLLNAGFPIGDLAGGWSLLHAAAAGGAAPAVELLLDEGAAIDGDFAVKGDVYERGTPLLVAVRRGHDGVVATLLGRGADARAGAAETPLHVACERGDVAAAAKLVAAGADAAAEDEDGDAPLDRAALACRLRYAFDEDRLEKLADALGVDAP